MPKICVYCGSSFGTSPVFRETAEALGRAIAQEGCTLVYGGGNVGLMGVVADAVLHNRGEVIGVIPHALKERELGHNGLTQLIAVDTMHERKKTMADLADAFIALPGGIGTMEELFEVYTWLQLRFHEKPIGLLNVDGYYDDLLRFIDRMVTSGFIHSDHRDLLLVDTDPHRLLQRVFLVAGS
jgi:uncharacterized protein (TIGR00730 family)